MRKRITLIAIMILSFTGSSVDAAGELVRLVRLKISAGDLASAVAAVEDYKKQTGVDVEYLDAVGWLARGAEMMNKREQAAAFVAELRREIPQEKAELLAPFGAAIEVLGKLLAAGEGRVPAVRFLEAEFARAKDIGLRSRIRKNINQLSLEGQPALPIDTTNFIGSQPASLTSLKGRPVLLFLWAHWCGDCRAQGASLSRVWQKYRAQGLILIAPTRFYGTGDQNKPASPEEEKRHMAKVWAETYVGLDGAPITIDTETMIRYGVSATPTFVLIDRKGIVRLYSATRLSEAELSKRIEAVLAESM